MPWRVNRVSGNEFTKSTLRYSYMRHENELIAAGWYDKLPREQNVKKDATHVFLTTNTTEGNPLGSESAFKITKPATLS
jgi:hypothetical protein